jgi:[acyl-carrier-protein] S-malonyltransferase
VLWEKSMRQLLAQGFTRFIELGPGTALSGFMKRIDKSAQMLNVADAAKSGGDGESTFNLATDFHR